MKSRTTRRLFLIIAPVVGLVFAISGVANAYNQGGRQVQTTDGTVANVNGTLFSPDSGHCIIFSVLAADFIGNSNHRQLETGEVRCNNATIDGTCSSEKFVETFSDARPQPYVCHTAGTFSTGTAHTFEVQRTTSSSATYISRVDNNAKDSLGDFTHADLSEAWGERTGSGTGCGGWGAGGYFTSWKTYRYSSGYQVVSGNVDNDEGCWSISGVDSSGAFNVTK